VTVNKDNRHDNRQRHLQGRKSGAVPEYNT